ncbi:hypothetical protein G6F22_021345 [Rhizopus arrhizus]|nr:hypothetical protein G6F22_021345 [Rhizopus arrhizus]
MDVEDPISGNYTLEVSSPGVDRPLFNLEQFGRHLGEMAKVTLKLPQDNRHRSGRVGRQHRQGTDHARLGGAGAGPEHAARSGTEASAAAQEFF